MPALKLLWDSNGAAPPPEHALTCYWAETGGREPALDAMIAEATWDPRDPNPSPSSWDPQRDETSTSARLPRSCSWGSSLAAGGVDGEPSGAGRAAGRVVGSGLETTQGACGSFIGRFRQPEAAAAASLGAVDGWAWGAVDSGLDPSQAHAESREARSRRWGAGGHRRALSFDRLAEGVVAEMEHSQLHESAHEDGPGVSAAAGGHLVASSATSSSRTGSDKLGSWKVASSGLRQSHCTSHKGSGKYF